MKKIIVAGIISAISFIAFYYIRLYYSAKKLSVTVDSFKLMSKLEDILSGFTLRFRLNLGNYSNSTFVISQIKIDAFTQADVALASQKSPLAAPISILPNQNNYPEFDFDFSNSGLANLILGGGNLLQMAQNFFVNGKFGMQIKLKGFVVAEGFKVDINQIVNI